MENVNLEKLSHLIKRAQGDRSQNTYALHCDLSSAFFTKVLNGERRPSPDALRKMADRAQNGVTYQELMEACGYLDGIDLGRKLTDEEWDIIQLYRAAPKDTKDQIKQISESEE